MFNRDAGDFKIEGDQGKLLKATEAHLLIETEEAKFRKSDSSIWTGSTICRPVELALTPGDRLQLKANAEACDGKPLVNGELVSVKEKSDPLMDESIFRTRRVLLPNFRQFVRDCAVTSYRSQGKTVEHVLFSEFCRQSGHESNQQWIVAISRGTKGASGLSLRTSCDCRRMSPVWGTGRFYGLNSSNRTRRSTGVWRRQFAITSKD